MSEIRVDKISEKTADAGITLKSQGTADNKPMVLTLQTAETDMAANDVIGKIAFQAPDEGTGTDAILVAAAIQARSEGDFSSSANATAIDFMVGASEAAATKMILSSAGKLDVSGGVDIEGGAVFNEDSADVDFRVESNDATHQLFVDGGNNKIYTGAGSGNSIDNMHLQLQNQGLTVSSFAGDANSNEIHFIKSRNTTVGSSTVVADGDQLGSIVFQGDDGTDYATPAASIRAIVGGTPGGNDMPGALVFSTTADGASSVTERVRIHNGGVMSASQGIALGVGINNTASNVLDDYEEGTYTPAFTVASGSLTVHNSHNTLAYTKIGRVVHVQGEIRFSAISSPSGNMSLNLPFAVADLGEGAARFTSAPIGQSGFSGTPNQTYYMRVTGEGVDTAFIATHNSGSDTGVNANQVSTSTEMIVSFTFIAA